MKKLLNLPFHNFCVSIGSIPSSYIESLSYYEQVLWLCKFLEEEVIPTVNNNSEVVSELQNLFNQLQEFINHYFDNLDVQEEINNKLDEMVLDGTLDRLLNKYISNKSIRSYENVEEMKQDITLFENCKVKTCGFNEINDGGAAFYKIVNDNNLIADGANIHELENGLKAILITDNGINIKQFGTLEDYSTVLQNLSEKATVNTSSDDNIFYDYNTHNVIKDRITGLGKIQCNDKIESNTLNKHYYPLQKENLFARDMNAYNDCDNSINWSFQRYSAWLWKKDLREFHLNYVCPWGQVGFNVDYQGEIPSEDIIITIDRVSVIAYNANTKKWEFAYNGSFESGSLYGYYHFNFTGNENVTSVNKIRTDDTLTFTVSPEDIQQKVLHFYCGSDIPKNPDWKIIAYKFSVSSNAPNDFLWVNGGCDVKTGSTVQEIGGTRSKLLQENLPTTVCFTNIAPGYENYENVWHAFDTVLSTTYTRSQLSSYFVNHGYLNSDSDTFTIKGFSTALMCITYIGNNKPYGSFLYLLSTGGSATVNGIAKLIAQTDESLIPPTIEISGNKFTVNYTNAHHTVNILRF